MFPYRDENETQRTPYITFTIIALNVITWLFSRERARQGRSRSLSAIAVSLPGN
jgi:hypothetical protein